MVPLLLQMQSQSADVRASLLLRFACKQGRTSAAVLVQEKMRNDMTAPGIIACLKCYSAWFCPEWLQGGACVGLAALLTRCFIHDNSIAAGIWHLQDGQMALSMLHSLQSDEWFMFLESSMDPQLWACDPSPMHSSWFIVIVC